MGRALPGVQRFAGLAICAAVSASALLHAGGAVGEQASQPASAAAAGLDLGANFSCAIVTGGQVRCWGYGGEGELGYPGVSVVGAANTPASVGPVDIGAGFTATAISSGGYHTCAIRNDGSVVCWGFGGDGRLGYGNRENVGDDETPGSVGAVDLGPGAKAKAISAGGGHTCAILDDGTVRCWGFGYSGQLGYGATSNVGDGAPDLSVATAGAVDLGAGHTATAISAGARHTCAILDDGSVRCWGNGGSGRLGNGSSDNVGDDETPGSVAPVDLGPGRTATSISAGDNHSCAILDDGGVRCWGYGYSGQLGYGAQGNVGDVPSSSVAAAGPVDLGAGATAVAISAGASHTCAILGGGGVVCWGYGAEGRLGYGATGNIGDRTTPGSAGRVDLGPGRTAIAISAGGRHTCARLDDGSVRCWGYGGNGRLGYCDEGNVGDLPGSTPGGAGPVNLVPGDGGEPCVPVDMAPPSLSGRPATGQVLSETHGKWSPPPSGYAYQWQRCAPVGGGCRAIAGAVAQRYTVRPADLGARIRVLESARDSAGAGGFVVSAPTALVTGALEQRARERGFHACLAKVRRAGRARGLERCVQAWGRTPGPVTGLRAITRGSGKLELQFIAPGTDAGNPPPARSYLIKQSTRAIRDRRAFIRAPALCGGACRFRVSRIGTRITLTINGLRRHTSYYYAVAARDDVTGRPGPRSGAVRARTA